MSLRYYQQECSDALYNAMGNPVGALPTGSGKTHVLVDLVRRYEEGVLVLSHVKEILDQNFTKMVQHGIDTNLYSAGFGMKSVGDVTVAGIQSAYKHPHLFMDKKIAIVDECHLVNHENSGMYREFLDTLDIKVIGLTATPYRTGYGYIHLGDTTLFDSIAIDYCKPHLFNQLVREGYLSNLISQSPHIEYDTTGMQTQMGDYKTAEMSDRFDKEDIVVPIIESWKQYQPHYKKWLVFAIDIEHAEHVARIMREQGIKTQAVHSKMNRDPVIQAFKDREIQAIVNVGVLTTGFDEPDIDLIGLLRPTKSPSLHCQMVGRGSRVSPGKDHCLVLDHAGNTARLGEINDLQIDHKGLPKKTGGEPIMKTCPVCNTYAHPTVKICKHCGHQFEFKNGLAIEHYSAEIIKTRVSKVNWHKVEGVSCERHNKVGSPDSVKVTYHCGPRFFTEYVCPDHPGFAGKKAKYWIRNRWPFPHNPPRDTNELLKHFNVMRYPAEIEVDERGKYAQIKDWRKMGDGV